MVGSGGTRTTLCVAVGLGGAAVVEPAGDDASVGVAVVAGADVTGAGVGLGAGAVV